MKKAFTFAEVLLVLMIIGILIGLCMGAGQVSLRNAYNLYYYRTYNALTTAFDNFLYLKKHEQTDADTGIVLPVNNLALAFQQHYSDMINSADGTSVTCAGINNDPFFDSCTVTVPRVKTRANQTGQDSYYVVFHCGYLRTAYTNPYTGEVKQAGEPSGFGPIMILIGNVQTNGTYSLSKNDANIIDNPSILPAYADNGVIGRRIENGTDVPTYDPIFPRTYREALCATYDNTDPNSIFNYLNDNTFFNIVTYCTGVSGTGADKYKGGTVKLLKPSNMRF